MSTDELEEQKQEEEEHDSDEPIMLDPTWTQQKGYAHCLNLL